VIPKQNPQNHYRDYWVKYICYESHTLFKTEPVTVEKEMELAELGFYEKMNEFESAQDMPGFYNKTFQKVSHVETGIVPRAIAEVVPSRESGPRTASEVIDH
jgi:hypothetical protein